MSAKRITVYKLAPSDRPHYQLQWVDADGARRTRSAGTRDHDHAELKRADLEYELNHGVVRPDGAAPLTWKEFRARYEEERLAGLAANTRRLACDALDKLEAAAPLASLASVGERQVRACRVMLERSGMQASSVRNCLSLVRASLRWAARQKLIPVAPHVEMPKVPKRGRIVCRLDAEGYARLRRDIGPGWRQFVDVAWYTGMRKSEILALSWEEGDDAPWIDAALTRVNFPAASHKARRDEWVPLHRELAEILRPLRGEGTGRVVTIPHGDDNSSRTFRRACAAAGFRLVPKDLRRAFGSRYASHVPPAVLQRLMRHADIRTTMSYYVDVDGSLEAAIHRL